MKHSFIINLVVLSFCFAVAADDPNRQEESIISKSKDLQEQLLTEDYKLPQEPNNIAGENELLNLVDELNALTFSIPIVSESNEKLKANDFNEPNDLLTKTADTNTIQLPATVDKIEQITKDPNTAINPLKLADVLFLNGNEFEAAIFYEKALSNIGSTNNKQEHPDEAWILFQIANCNRKIDPQKAEQCYKQLIEKFPACQWIQQASVQQKISKLLSSEKDTIEYAKKKPDIEITQ